MKQMDLVGKLLHSVDKLTVGENVPVLQEVDDEIIIKSVTVPPLIGLLRDAIVSSTTGRGGGSLPSERNVLDSDALDAYRKIEAEIIDFYRSVTASKPFASPEQNLRQWFIAISNDFRAGKIADEKMFEYIQNWVNWIHRIEEKLFPPTQLEVISDCPICGKRWTLNQAGESIPAIVIVYREPSSARVGALSRSAAKCRDCGTVWRGDRRLRELAFAIGVKQHADADVMSHGSGTIEGPVIRAPKLGVDDVDFI